MPANIEIKARIGDLAAFKKRAMSLSNSQVEIIPQEDIFFHTPQGRLKLRILAPDYAQLVYYTRSDAAGPKRSEYLIHEIKESEALKTLLGRALGVRGVVRKTRHLFKVGQTRVHLDEVDGLGTFVELEVILRQGQSDAEGQAIAEDLMGKLGIKAEDLMEGAYMDLIEGR
jgi:predicted adenylyl cyclase CyaB